MNSGEILARLKRAPSLALIAHVSPDGDTIGSVLGLYHALGARARLFCVDPMPPKYAFLPGIDKFETPVAAHFELALAIDCADIARLGSCAEIFGAADARIVIDHHGTNVGFGDINIIKPDYGATGTIIREMLPDSDVTDAAAICLYTAISTDTGNFSFSSTLERDMRAAASLIERFDLSEVTRKLYRLKRLAHTRLLGRMISGMRVLREGKIAVGALTAGDISECEAVYADTDGLIDHLINIEGVEIAILATEKRGAKISIRTLHADASAIAQKFGGGGHARAAGATVEAGISEAIERVLREV